MRPLLKRSRQGFGPLRILRDLYRAVSINPLWMDEMSQTLTEHAAAILALSQVVTNAVANANAANGLIAEQAATIANLRAELAASGEDEAVMPAMTEQLNAAAAELAAIPAPPAAA